MAEYLLWTVCTWTFKGILCTCRFLWICPYNAAEFSPRGRRIAEDASMPLKRLVGSECEGTVPGSPDRTTELRKRLTKVEKEILTMKTRISYERASWERRFGELQQRQEELHYQTGALVNMGSCDNGEVSEDGSSASLRGNSLVWRMKNDHFHIRTASVKPQPASGQLRFAQRQQGGNGKPGSVQRLTKGPRRVFVPHSPLDLAVGHRVRIMLPSGRISTGTVRYLGRLRGEAELHLGVELQTPEHGLHDGSHRGHSYFKCEPGHGAFVPFHKLLMAWE